MKQTRAMSLIEAATNVIVGYGLAVITQILIFPVFGLHATLAQNLKMGFTKLEWQKLRERNEALDCRVCAD